jgi:LPS-assembly protein
LANNFRLEENNNISNINQMNEKISNLFNEIQYNYNENLSIKYTSAIKNNLKDIEYESFKSNLNFKNFISEFDYINENNTFDKNSYISNKSILNLNKFNSVEFNTRKNKTKDLTEYYNMIYRYKNDCLAASVEFNKDFYSDKELKPETSLFFKLTIIPFGEISGPDIIQ